MNFKRNWKKVLALLTGVFALVLILTACGSKSGSETKSPGTLTIGVSGNYTPYSYRDNNGKLTGYEVEIGQKVAKKLNLKADFVPTKWDSLIAGLGSGKFDMVMNNLSATPERKQSFLFGSPYMYSHSNLITRSNDKSIQNVKDIKGKKFVEGTGTDNQAIAEKFGAKTVPSSEFATSMDLIREGRADGAVNTTSSWYTYSKSNNTKGLKEQEIPTSEQKANPTVPMFNKNSSKLQGKVNKAINQLKKDGTLKKLSVKYFGSDMTNK